MRRKEALKGQKMKICNETFGNLQGFEAGQLVCWSNFEADGTKKIGVISEMYFIGIGGRNVAYAKIFCLKDDRNYNLPTIILKIVSRKD